jgi:hypothetical protein
MFFDGSRYQKTGEYTIKRADGVEIAATKLPLRSTTAPYGYHRHTRGERLDHLAYKYLGDATASWKLCDANNSMVPDSLAGQDLIGIPGQED